MRLRNTRRPGQGSDEGCGGCVAVVVVAGLIYAGAGGGCGGPGGNPSKGEPSNKGGGTNAVVNLIDRGLTYVREVPTRVEPPVEVSLRPFLLLSGYYVTVRNTTADVTLTGVTVTYVGASGNTVSQAVGTLPPGRAVQLDPSDIRWQVERNEQIRVSADGYLSKSVATNSLVR